MKKVTLSKFRLIAYIVGICLVMILFIGLTAHSAELQYDINLLNSALQDTQRQIQTLEVKIKTATNITNLETRAHELGLVYPTFDQIVYLRGEEKPVDDFAIALMESTYGN